MLQKLLLMLLFNHSLFLYFQDKDDEAKVKDASSYSISYLAKYLKPRYHFCGLSGLYYERVPYRFVLNFIAHFHAINIKISKNYYFKDKK